MIESINKIAYLKLSKLNKTNFLNFKCNQKKLFKKTAWLSRKPIRLTSQVQSPSRFRPWTTSRTFLRTSAAIALISLSLVSASAQREVAAATLWLLPEIAVLFLSRTLLPSSATNLTLAMRRTELIAPTLKPPLNRMPRLLSNEWRWSSRPTNLALLCLSTCSKVTICLRDRSVKRTWTSSHWASQLTWYSGRTKRIKDPSIIRPSKTVSTTK